MPYKRARYSQPRSARANYGKKRKFVKRRKVTKKRPITTVIRGVSILPDRYMVKLKYIDFIHFSAAASGNYVFRGNSTFDPDFTGTGHQPMGYDELQTLYRKVRVFGSKISVKVNSESATPEASSAVVVLTPQGILGGNPAKLSDAMEHPRARWRLLSTYNGGGAQRSLRNYMSTRQIEGITKAKAADADYSSQTDAVPLKKWYWRIHYSSTNETSSIDLTLCVQLIYYCVFFDRHNLAGS